MYPGYYQNRKSLVYTVFKNTECGIQLILVIN